MTESKQEQQHIFERLDKAGLPADFLSDSDRDRSLSHEGEAVDELCKEVADESQPLTDEDRAWMIREDWEPDCDDEPRTNGKSPLELFRESCESADAGKRRTKRAEEDSAPPAQRTV